MSNQAVGQAINKQQQFKGGESKKKKRWLPLKYANSKPRASKRLASPLLSCTFDEDKKDVCLPHVLSLALETRKLKSFHSIFFYEIIFICCDTMLIIVSSLFIDLTIPIF